MRYHQFSVLSVLAAAPLANFATHLAPPWDNIRVKHTWNDVPPNWEALGHPPAGTTIDLHLALRPHHENALIDALYRVSDPESPTYGSHLSREQVAQLVEPHPDTLELVHSWLAHHDVPSSSVSTTHGGSWLTLTGVPVFQANKLLGASYQLYRRKGTNDTTILRTIGYALPAVLHTHVRTVAPTTYFAPARIPRKTPQRRTVGETTGTTSGGVPVTEKVIPADLRWLYRTYAYVPAATDRNGIGTVNFEGDYPSPADLTTFMTKCRTDGEDATFKVVRINGGGYDPRKPDEEPNQNIQYAQGIAYPTPHTYYNVGGQRKWYVKSKKPARTDVYLKWLNYVISQQDVPQTISISYGDDEKGVPMEYANSLCILFAQLGARGVSVIFPSGNDGVGEGDCKDDSGRVQFAAEFPSTCPYVTSVGGVTGLGPEAATDFSGGGFSNYFPRPDYQDEVVPKFLQHLGSQYDGLYNAAGRGIPDISAQALNFYMILNNQDHYMSGTSCAAPAPGIISLLNDYLISNGEKPLGFLNPWLYSNGRAGLKDVVFGSNPGCGTEGFSATVGWDPISGLGTPRFSFLQDTVVLNSRSSTRRITRE
ncbi:subtilisin-like protein [Lactarius psammicola]|nr:subtilisin-like protein [Lactarius psammicola]